jgi:hypothetical protein
MTGSRRLKQEDEMNRPRAVFAFLLAVATVTVAASFGTAVAAVPPTEPGTAKNFEIVGQDPLLNRGMNAAPALYRDPATGEKFVYVGSRTDGSHPNAGVLVVRVTDPADPQIVNQIGPPNEGNPSETSRELRVWPREKLLMVMNFQCSAVLHACASPADVIGSLTHNIKFYDLTDPANPTLVSTYMPSRHPHEMFLWQDPEKPNRALLYISTPTSSTNPDRPNLIVTDISGAREGEFEEILAWNGNPQYAEEAPDEFENRDVRLHAVAVSLNGKRAYLAYLGGGFLVLDTSDLADGSANPTVSLITPPTNTPRWPNQTAHTSLKVPGRRLALVTDEVYGDLLDPLVRPENEFGCPWGWVHLIDITDQSRPKLVGEFRTFENEDAYCQSADGQDPANTTSTSYSAHNPTVLRNLAFVTWHSGGLQSIWLGDPAAPTQTGFISPEPLPVVQTEDPALSAGRNKVVAWSYPIISDGLIYYVDIRNGLYIVKYTGRGRQSVGRIRFLEGNSNVGDAARLGN